MIKNLCGAVQIQDRWCQFARDTLFFNFGNICTVKGYKYLPRPSSKLFKMSMPPVYVSLSTIFDVGLVIFDPKTN